MTPAWMAALSLFSAGVIAVLAWDQRRFVGRLVEAERQGRPLSEVERDEWAAIVACLMEESEQ